MSTHRTERTTLRAQALGGAPGRWIADSHTRIPLVALAAGSCLDGHAAEALHGASVLIATDRPMAAALAAIELDGIARRLVLCPPETEPEALPAIMAEAAIDVVLTDRDSLPAWGAPALRCTAALDWPARPRPALAQNTEWVLFTSGTTGQPKLVVHDLASLLGPALAAPAGAPVWSSFYDIRRYGGLVILLRALTGGCMVLADRHEPVGAFLDRAENCGVTHLTGTPSHWRRALMSPRFGQVCLDYIRLSGEVADQAILDRLRAAFPTARLVHAFATTEAGLAFEVDDGQAGFPAATLDHPGAAELRIAGGTLRIRSPRTAWRYLGRIGPRDAQGWVDTGDQITASPGRLHFAGRREGVINVGGQKVHPEEVEAVINQHPAVQACRVWARPNPITGAIVAADIVLRPQPGGAGFEPARLEILAACRAALSPHKVPTSLRQVAALTIGASGKLLRHG